jgi:hypothetical protein
MTIKMNIFSRKRCLHKVEIRSHVDATNDGNAAVIDNTSVATDDSLHSQSLLMMTSSPQEIYQAEKRLKKNRRLVNKYVRKIGSQANLKDSLELDSYGFCYIPFKRFLIILSVPQDNPEHVVLQTMIFDLGGKDETKARRKLCCMQYRQVHLGRHKSVIQLEGDEVFLSNCFLIQGLRYAEMVDRLDDFMETALNTNTDLTALSR